jgi:hypothetical protein
VLQYNDLQLRSNVSLSIETLLTIATLPVYNFPAE